VPSFIGVGGGYAQGMQLGDKDLAEFIELYEAEFEEPLSHEEARDMVSRLLVLYELLSKPLPEEGGGGELR
jgi:hypothetical protein